MTSRRTECLEKHFILGININSMGTCHMSITVAGFCGHRHCGTGIKGLVMAVPPTVRADGITVGSVGKTVAGRLPGRERYTPGEYDLDGTGRHLREEN